MKLLVVVLPLCGAAIAQTSFTFGNGTTSGNVPPPYIATGTWSGTWSTASTGTPYAPVTADGWGNLSSVGALASFGPIGGQALSISQGSQSALVLSVPNDGTTATVVNRLACWNGSAGTAVPCNSSAGAVQVIGIVYMNGGTGGAAAIVRMGTAACVFDTSPSPTVGHFVIPSPSNAGQCRDGGANYPVGAQPVGIVTALGYGGSGVNNVFVMNDIPAIAAGPSGNISISGGTGLAATATVDIVQNPTFTTSVTSPLYTAAAALMVETGSPTAAGASASDIRIGGGSGASSTTGAGGAGGIVRLLGGNAGSSAGGSPGTNGANVTLQGGAGSGTGTPPGAPGNILLAPAGGLVGIGTGMVPPVDYLDIETGSANMGLTINGAKSGGSFISSGGSYVTLNMNSAAVGNTGIGYNLNDNVDAGIVGASFFITPNSAPAPNGVAGIYTSMVNGFMIVGQDGTSPLLVVDQGGHLTPGGTGPTSSAGTVTGSDTGGRIVLSSAPSSVTISFGSSYPSANPPACAANDENHALAVQAQANVTPGMLTLKPIGGTFNSGDSLTWVCVGT